MANFQEPAPPTQAGFFFFGTELLNPCMWSTDSDFLQAPYYPGNGSDAAACEGCKVKPYSPVPLPVASLHCEALTSRQSSLMFALSHNAELERTCRHTKAS